MSEKPPLPGELYQEALKQKAPLEVEYKSVLICLHEKGWKPKEISLWLALRNVRINSLRIAAYLREHNNKPQQ